LQSQRLECSPQLRDLLLQPAEPRLDVVADAGRLVLGGGGRLVAAEELDVALLLLPRPAR
jgi:hypothetical protein